MKELLIISSVVYVLSMLYCRWWIRSAHSRNGVWNHSEMTIADILVAHVPVINTLGIIMGMLKSPYKGSDKIEKLTEWIFGVKR